MSDKTERISAAVTPAFYNRFKMASKANGKTASAQLRELAENFVEGKEFVPQDSSFSTQFNKLEEMLSQLSADQKAIVDGLVKYQELQRRDLVSYFKVILANPEYLPREDLQLEDIRRLVKKMGLGDYLES